MKKSGESLTVKPKVNLSIPISVFQKWRVSVVMQFNGEKKKPPGEGAGVQDTEVQRRNVENNDALIEIQPGYELFLSGKLLTSVFPMMMPATFWKTLQGQRECIILFN